MDRRKTDPRWCVTEDAWEPERNHVWESIFTVGNGYLGVRGFPEEAFDAGPSLIGTYVAGVYAADADGIPEIVNVADVLAVKVTLAGRRMKLSPTGVSEYVRTLDMKRGILTRAFVYSHEGRSTAIVFERFTSLPRPHILGQKITITPLDWGGRVGLTFLMDAQVRNKSIRHLEVVRRDFGDQHTALLVTELRRGDTRIAQAFRSQAWIHQTRPPSPQPVDRDQRIGLRYVADLESGQRAVFERVIATYTSRDSDAPSPARAARSAVRKSAGLTYQKARRSQVQAWQRTWDRRDVQIDGPIEDQRAVRFAIFQLTQACSRFDSTVSIGAKALTGEAYRGHVFWDTEIFILPFFIHADPPAARRLLEYRYHTLNGARQKARDAGYQGAMFAWESADTGEETCPRYVPDPKTGDPVRVWCGEIEQHISADVVYGGWHYCRATGDDARRRSVLTEIAIETARFWASRVTWHEGAGRYEIHDVIGPDEYHEHVNNNAFTNFMAAWNLRIAAEWLQQLAEEEPRRWRALVERRKCTPQEPQQWIDIADRLHVPFDRDRGIHTQDDTFLQLADVDPHPLSSRVSPDPESVRMAKIWRSQVLKQADVVMLIGLWPDRFSTRVKKADFNYYEPRTTHDSSLSASMHSVVASRLGYRQKAYDYFRLSALIDLEDRMGNTNDGLHAAAMGGTYQAVLFGFLGLELGRDRPRLRPRLPKEWRSVSLGVHYRGRLFDVHVSRQSCDVTEHKA